MSQGSYRKSRKLRSVYASDTILFRLGTYWMRQKHSKPLSFQRRP